MYQRVTTSHTARRCPPEARTRGPPSRPSMIWGGWSCIPHASNATVRNSDTQHLRMRRPAPTAPRPGLASLWALEPSIARANLAVQPVLLVLVLALVLSSACRPLSERSASLHPSIHASIHPPRAGGTRQACAGGRWRRGLVDSAQPTRPARRSAVASVKLRDPSRRRARRFGSLGLHTSATRRGRPAKPASASAPTLRQPPAGCHVCALSNGSSHVATNLRPVRGDGTSGTGLRACPPKLRASATAHGLASPAPGGREPASLALCLAACRAPIPHLRADTGSSGAHLPKRQRVRRRALAGLLLGGASRKGGLQADVHTCSPRNGRACLARR